MARNILLLAAALLGYSYLWTAAGQGPGVAAQPEPLTAAKVKTPSETARTAAKNVVKLLAQEHLLGKLPLPEVSRRWLHLFLKDLDSNKLYFTRADHEALHKREQEYAELFQKGEVGFVYDIFQTFLRRVDERHPLIKELIVQNHDFTVDEEVVIDSAKAEFAQSDEQVKENWRKRIKLDLLLLKADGVPDDEARERLQRRLSVQASLLHKLGEDGLLEGALTALARAYDPKNYYLSPQSWQETLVGLRNQLEGIGAQLQLRDGECIVLRVLPGSPAQKDGRLKPGDKITGVEKDGKLEDVAGWRLSDIVRLIRGPSQTKVRLEVIQAGQTERLLYTLTRDRIDSAGARSAVLEAGQKKIGYLFLPSLYGEVGGVKGKSSATDLRQLLEDPREGLNARGVDLVILDLRTNTGGILSQTIAVCDLFLDHGPVLQVKDKAGKVVSNEATEKGVVYNGPLVIMTSKQTSSGAEIVAGVLQSYGRALVVGEPTFGAGTVQQFFDVASLSVMGKTVGDLGLVRISYSQFYRPNGESVQKRGVLPDLELPWLTDPGLGEAASDFALEFDRVDALLVQRANFGIDELLRKKLRKLSAERREKSADFLKLAQAIDVAVRRQKQGTLTLQAEKYLAERKLFPLDSVRSQKVQDTLPVERDFYMDEVVAVAADYLGLLQNRPK